MKKPPELKPAPGLDASPFRVDFSEAGWLSNCPADNFKAAQMIVRPNGIGEAPVTYTDDGFDDRRW